ncbi:hypothetical protein [Streptomyces sp. NPDC001315]
MQRALRELESLGLVRSRTGLS